MKNEKIKKAILILIGVVILLLIAVCANYYFEGIKL